MSLSRTENTELCVDDCYQYQGRSLSIEAAEEVDLLQRRFVVSSLNEGFEDLAAFENLGYMANVIGTANIHPGLMKVFSELNDLAELIRLTPRESHFFIISNQLKLVNSLIKEIWADYEGCDAKRFFSEFLLGLLRFEIAVRMAASFARNSFAHDPRLVALIDAYLYGGIESNRVLSGLNESGRVAEELGSAFNRLNPGYAEVFWKNFTENLSAFPTLGHAAKNLASLHGRDVGDGFTAMSQVLHWNGFGGSGEMLRDFPELQEVSSHSIAYHGEQGKGGHFSQRMRLFGEVIAPLKAAGLKILAGYLNEFVDRDEVKVFDVGSGRNAQGVAGAANYLSEGKNFKITVTDNNGALLKEMAEVKERNGGRVNDGDRYEIEDVRYLDLTGSLNEGGEASSYDVFSASFVLHQLMDRTSGEDQVAKVMKFGTALVRPGGVIHLPSVGEGAYLQFPIIPANLVDSEGCLPANLIDRVSFEDVGVNEGKKVKIPYPLRRLHRFAPKSLGPEEAIYQYDLYVVIEIPFRDLAILDEYREKGDWESCDAIIESYLDIGKIQDQVLNQVDEVKV